MSPICGKVGSMALSPVAAGEWDSPRTEHSEPPFQRLVIS
jgi:hypothetical protein